MQSIYSTTGWLHDSIMTRSSESSSEEILQAASSQDDSVFISGEAGDQRVKPRRPSLRNRRRPWQNSTSVVPIDPSAKRNILILGKNGEGKSTVGNVILRSNHFKIGNTDLPRTCVGTSAVDSMTQLQSYIVKVYDHDGLFDHEIPASLSSLFNVESINEHFIDLNLVIFVLKQGHMFQQHVLDTINYLREWDISEISALVITHCEKLTEKEREIVINQFQTDYPAVTKFMKAGIITVGFPDNRYAMDDPSLAEGIKTDAAEMRQLIYSSEIVKRISRPTLRSTERKQEPERKPTFRSSSFSSYTPAVQDKPALGSDKDLTPLPALKTTSLVSNVEEMSPRSKQDITNCKNNIEHSPGPHVQASASNCTVHHTATKVSPGGNVVPKDRSIVGNNGSQGQVLNQEKLFHSPNPVCITSKTHRQTESLSTFSIARQRFEIDPSQSKSLRDPGQCYHPIKSGTSKLKEQQQSPKSSPNSERCFLYTPQGKPLDENKNTRDSSKELVYSPRSRRRLRKSKSIQDITKMFEDSSSGGCCSQRSSDTQPCLTSSARQEKLTSSWSVSLQGTKQASVYSTGGANDREHTSLSSQDSRKCLKSDIDQLEVQHHFLSSLEWKETNGSDNVVKVTVYKAAKSKWDKIAECLGLKPNAIKSIRRECHDDHQRVTDVFSEWFDNANQLPNNEKYPLKWSGLIRLLRDSELGQLAEDLRCALSAPFSNVKGNLSQLPKK